MGKGGKEIDKRAKGRKEGTGQNVRNGRNRRKRKERKQDNERRQERDTQKQERRQEEKWRKGRKGGRGVGGKTLRRKFRFLPFLCMGQSMTKQLTQL
jgi:hypothetical protein